MQTKEAIAEQWLGRVLRTYPIETARFLAEVPDPFRNPVGCTLRQSLRILLDELMLGMEPGHVTAALESIVQIRAVDDCMPSHALEFLFQLKEILRELAPDAALDMLDARIDTMALSALDLYVKYREKTFQAKASEARRRVYILERRMAAGAETVWHERGAK